MTTQAAETKETNIWVLVDGSPLATVLARLAEKAKAHGKGDYSVQYWTEDMLARGCETFNRYLDADKERRDTASFNIQLSKLTPPNPNDATALALYANQILALQRKYGIGGEKKTL